MVIIDDNAIITVLALNKLDNLEANNLWQVCELNLSIVHSVK